MLVCSICRTPLDQPGRSWTANCGGDCRACMVSFGDPDEIAKLRVDLIDLVKKLSEDV